MEARTRRKGRPKTRSRRTPAGRSVALAPFLSLFESIPFGAVLLSPEGRFVRANRAFRDFIGQEEAELKRRAFDDLAYSADASSIRELLQRLKRGEVKGFEVEKRFVRRDGRLVWGRVAVHLMPKGSSTGFSLGIVVDVSTRRSRDETRRLSEEQYRQLYNRTPTMMHSIDADGKILSVSDRWLATLGYRREEVLGRRSIEFLTPESRAYAESTVLPAFFKSGYVNDVQYQYQTKGGEIIDVELSATCERDRRGRVLRSLAVLVDVTARRRAERALAALTADLEKRVAERTAEVQMRTAVLTAMQEAAIDGILVVDPDRKIISHNARFVEMWGLMSSVLALGCDETAIRNVLDKLVDPEGFTERVEALYKDCEAKSFDELELKDGRTFERYSSPVVSAAGRYYGRIWYFRDITRRKQAELELQRKTGALQRSNKDLEAYAYTASHDLKAPLAKIDTFAQFLSSSSPLTDKQRDLAGRISRCADRMKTLVSDVLTLSRVAGSDAPVEEVDAGQVMAEVLSDLEAQIKQAGATVEVGPLPRLRAHTAFIRLLLQNLVGNAIKFRREGVPPKIRVESRMTPDGVEISVADNGIGFDPKNAKKIFEPFARLHAGYEGSGIGLPACERIAARYGGQINATSAPGRGSTFRVWLPRSAVVEAR